MSDVADRRALALPEQPDELHKQRQALIASMDAMRERSVSQRQRMQLYRVESLLRRTAVSRPELASRLLKKAEQLLNGVGQTTRECPDQHPAVGSLLSELIKRLQQRASVAEEDQEPSTFEALLRRQEVEALRQVDDEEAVANLDAIAPVGELKALKQLREDWAKRGTEKAIAKALDEAPEDAGPLNAHRLVVKALETMQDVSPEYLARFVNYVETVLWLEQASSKLLPRKEDKGKRRR